MACFSTINCLLSKDVYPEKDLDILEPKPDQALFRRIQSKLHFFRTGVGSD